MMKRFFMLSVAVIALSTVASAQSFPKAEVYGTYSLLVTDIDILDNETIHGFGIGLQGNLNKYFGLVAEFNSNHGRSDGPFVVSGRTIKGVDTRINSVLFGPRLSLRTKPVTVFGHYLIGPANSKLDEDPGAERSNTEFSQSFGGGIDINVTNRFAIRAGQFDYHAIHSDAALNNGGSSWFRNFRYQAGVVFKF
jgi:opacity protein-like surface antigen